MHTDEHFYNADSFFHAGLSSRKAACALARTPSWWLPLPLAMWKAWPRHVRRI